MDNTCSMMNIFFSESILDFRLTASSTLSSSQTMQAVSVSFSWASSLSKLIRQLTGMMAAPSSHAARQTSQYSAKLVVHMQTTLPSFNPCTYKP